MKRILLNTFIVSLISFNAAAVSADDSLIALNKAEQLVASLPEEGNYQKNDGKHRDQVFSILEDAVKAFKESTEDQLLLDQIVKLASAMNKKDSEQYSSELISSLVDFRSPELQSNPASKKRREQFESATKKLSAKDASALKQSIQNVLRAKYDGNGAK